MDEKESLNIADYRYERVFSKFDNYNMALLGCDGLNNWRRFRMTNSEKNVEYYRCLDCEKIIGLEIIFILIIKLSPQKIANLIIRSGELEGQPFDHDPRCTGKSYAVLKASSIDRDKRRKVADKVICGDPKSMWREVYYI